MSDIDLNACSRINKVLTGLEKQSTLEKSGLTDVSHEDSMLAITSDTGKFFSILLSSNTRNIVLILG